MMDNGKKILLHRSGGTMGLFGSSKTEASFRALKDLTQLWGDLRRNWVLASAAVPCVEDLDLRIKLVDSQAELEEVLHWIQEQKEKSKIPSHFSVITPQHFAPSTSWLVAKRKGKMIGFMTLVSDSALGLELDRTHNLFQHRAQFSRLIQVRDIALFSTGPEAIADLLWMLKYSLIYALKFKRSDLVLFHGLGPWHQTVGEILGLEKWQGVHLLKRLDWKDNLGEGIVGESTQKIRRFLTNDFGMSSFLFPERQYFCATDPSLSPDALLMITEKHRELLMRMNETALMNLRNAYPHQHYGDVLPKVAVLPDWMDQRKFRSDFASSAFEMNIRRDVEIVRASDSGMLLFSAKPLPKKLDLKCHIGKELRADITAEVVTEAAKNIYGVKILKSDSIWSGITPFSLKGFLKLVG